MDRGRGLAVMLFHVEGDLESVVMHNISFLSVSRIRSSMHTHLCLWLIVHLETLKM